MLGHGFFLIFNNYRVYHVFASEKVMGERLEHKFFENIDY